MRPTAVFVEMNKNGIGKIFMIGGDKDRLNLVYDTKTNEWSWITLLPRGHNLTCNVCVNYHDKAIFTFILDGKFNLRIAVLPLENI